MTRKLKTIACLGCASMLTVAVSCSLLRKPTLPQTGVVPIRAWIVLAPGESVGNRSNDGCRMTMAEVTAFLESLRSHARMFGGNVRFEPIEVATIEDFGLFLHGRLEPFSAFSSYVLLPYWMEDRLNIYFTGAVQTPPPIVLPWATTSDPEVAPLGHPFILINDGGDTLGSGFKSYRTPSEVNSYHILEHEMAHYLLRRNYAPGYDADEHVPFDTLNNILWPGIRLPPDVPAPDILPLALPSQEQRQAWCRVFNGVWNLPSPECDVP